jgi:hypothetical protein
MPSGRSARRVSLGKAAEVFGAIIPTRPVCPGHRAPMDFFEAWVFDRPPISLVHGPRGGGKSFLRGLASHLNALRNDGLDSRILGGSLSQSEQVYNAIEGFAHRLRGTSLIQSITKTRVRYGTGSEVSLLAASETSVRGPHVAELCLDEVDEIDSDLRESAMGMSMGIGGIPGSVAMTSTWHRLAGPMAELVARGEAGDFPVFRFCAFEVLERCPEDRSGSELEHCPACPLMPWCHSGEDGPRAKRAAGHYPIDSLIQKARTVSRRVFEADYLCLGPKADGAWFRDFDRARHVGDEAEYDPALPVYLAVDTGVFTGAVFYQVRDVLGAPAVSVFADYLAENRTARENATAILEIARTRCNGKVGRATTDPAGGARNPIGPTAIAEYKAAGLPLIPWETGPGSVLQGLQAIEALVSPADGVCRLSVHPHCKQTIAAVTGYRRAKRGGQWQDYPEDPQHPHEDLMDALRGGVYRRIRTPRLAFYP